MWRRFALGTSGLVLLLGLAACGGGDSGESAPAAGTVAQGAEGSEASEGSQSSSDEVAVMLTEQNGSGEFGVATLTAAGAGRTRVVVEIVDATSPSQPAHIHRGTCSDLDPTPLYGLVNVRDGRSEAVVDAPLSELTAGGLALNVHESDEEIDMYVACGDLPGAADPAATTDRGAGY